MNLRGGTMPVEEYHALNGMAEALKLIRSERGRVTPRGIVYENGMRMEPLCKRAYALHFKSRRTRGNRGLSGFCGLIGCSQNSGVTPRAFTRS